jgi:hypothetical protein
MLKFKVHVSREQTEEKLISSSSARSSSSEFFSSYQKGPIGGGISKGVNPLIHRVRNPSPTLRMYCSAGRLFKLGENSMM